jgi:hypothetical protein
MKVDSILVDKLDFVTEKSVKSLVERSKTDAELAMAIATTRTETGVQIGEFFIEKQEFDISGLKKNYYNIIDTEQDEVLYSELAMFESVMGIVKRLLTSNSTQKTDAIAKLDEEYDRNLLEAYGYKHRLKNTKDTMKRDVYEAKYSNAMAKVKTTKHRILKTL